MAVVVVGGFVFSSGKRSQQRIYILIGRSNNLHGFGLYKLFHSSQSIITTLFCVPSPFLFTSPTTAEVPWNPWSFRRFTVSLCSCRGGFVLRVFTFLSSLSLPPTPPTIIEPVPSEVRVLKAELIINYSAMPRTRDTRLRCELERDKGTFGW